MTVEDNLGPVVEVETGSGTAGPVDVTFTFTTDTYGAAEAFATLYDSDGATVADYPLGSFSNSAVSEETVSLDPGTYTIVLGDDWGDGWSWAPATGLDVLVLSGGANGFPRFRRWILGFLGVHGGGRGPNRTGRHHGGARTGWNGVHRAW